ncbi:Oidioi.mRNA.OKI2018_I69.chr2.g7850.t1.cds [Oikopleura dioica]|uniref:Oidioi.mRNA.OKI2018_I69.chr2.g7850.t1.cds n=1 Tax=Oikopleura dioica TaxID=34765 RepID=A0ABN7T9T7_OIKDI|nr:Oidioi.mRNA.OKI2018_I69.chr2.g7850.t1.cds [Oikopleura dioica]
MKKILYILVYASNAQFNGPNQFKCGPKEYCNEVDNRRMELNCKDDSTSCTTCPKNMENDGYRCKPTRWEYGNHDDTQPACPAGTSRANNEQQCSVKSGEVIGIGAVTCPPGTYGTITTGGFSDCTPCVRGDAFSCPGGSSTDPCSSSSSFCEHDYCTKCTSCPSNAVCDKNGVVEFCNTNQIVSGNVCVQKCDAGKDCVTGNDCAAGKYRDQYSSTDECMDCPEGYSCAGGAALPVDCPEGEHAAAGQSSCTNWSDSLACPDGSYPKDGTAFCDPCPQGYSCSTTSSDSTVCPDGQYSALGEMTCSPCPTEHVCPTGGIPYRCKANQELKTSGSIQYCATKTSSIIYAACPDGYACDNNNNPLTVCQPGTYSNNRNCAQCPIGSMCPYPEMGSPITCQHGYYQDSTGSTWCKECPAGYRCTSNSAAQCNGGQYSNIGDMDCHVCPTGYFCNAQDASAPVLCPPGTFTVGTGNTECTECPAGSRCAHGKKEDCLAYYYSKKGQTICLPCPAGHQCSNNVLTRCAPGTYSNMLESACKNCEAGFYCPSDGTEMENEIKVICPLGYYCDPGSPAPKECPKGTYGPNMGLTGLGDCMPCPNGYFCPPATPGYPSEKQLCPLGHYCTGTSINQCPGGTYNDMKGAYDASHCKDCKAGRFCPAGTGWTTPGNPCSRGHFCHEEGMANAQVCPPGTYNSGRGAKFASKCIPCPAGHFCCDSMNAPWEVYGDTCTGGVAEPQPCRKGTYQERRGQFTCDLCPAGKNCPDERMTMPLDCEFGKFCMIGTGADTVQPVRCPFGFLNDRLNATSMDDCEPCPPGYYCDHTDGNTWMSAGQHPTPCPPGQYCMERTPKNGTYFCPKGTFNNQEMLTHSVNCTTCPAGKFCEIGAIDDGKGINICPTGHFCPPGTGGDDDDDPDIPECPAGTYNNQTGMSRVEDCVVCPAGSFCGSGDSDFTQCEPGSYSDQTGILSQSECDRCPAGYKCSGGSSVEVCGIGFYSDYGAKDCLICEKGRYCHLNTTTYEDMWFYNVCPEGTDCSAGGKDHIPDLKRDACPLGQWCAKGDVKAYQSEPQNCPVGTYGQRVGLSNKYECDKCPAGFYCDTEAIKCESLLYGAPDGDDCDGVKVCPKGHYCELGSELPVPCGPGFYRSITDTQAAVNQTSCSICKSGYYCDQYGTHDDFGNAVPDDFTDATQLIKICPKGSYCPPGSIFPELCDAGTYGPAEGFRSSYECIPCDEGTYCPERGMEITGQNCTAGYYCSGGSKSKNPIDGVTGNICPKGYYCEAGTPQPQECNEGFATLFEGATSSTDCKECYPGYYCPKGNKLPCEPGKFCPAGSSEGEDCPAGHYCKQRTLLDFTMIGAIHPAPCSPGSFAAASNRETCEQCTAGFFCPVQKMTEGYSCPPGYYCPTGSRKPLACAAGKYNPLSESTSESDCQFCPVNHYCDSAGMSEAKPCPAGYACEVTGIVNPLLEEHCDGTDCYNPKSCKPGYFCEEGKSPERCPPGTYNPRYHGLSEKDCIECTPGKVCSVPGLEAPDGDCLAGYYCSGGAARPSGATYPVQPCAVGYKCPTGSPDQIPCERGTYSTAGTQDKCLACPAGSLCVGNIPENPTAGQEVCPVGQFCSGGDYEGEKCPRGTYSPNDGRSLLTECIDCDAGHYCPERGMNATGPECEAGFICKTKALYSHPNKETETDDSNTLCPIGFFCEQGTEEPEPCPIGTFGSIPGLKSRNDCSPCPGGTFCPSVGMTWDDIYDSTSNAINGTVKCEPGYFCKSGCTKPDPLSSSDCSSSVSNSGGKCPRKFMCPKGSTEPVPCPIGEYQDADLQDSCKPCEDGNYCENGVMRPCRKGYYCKYDPSTVPYLPTPCPIGTYNNLLGQKDGGVCDPCPAGYYCPKYGLGSGTEFKCAAGFKCTGGTIEARPKNKNGDPCPIGTYSAEGASEYRDCKKGHYCDKVGLTDAEMDSNECAAGYFCDTGSISATPKDASGEFIFCSVGNYCPKGADSELPCPPGTFSNSTGGYECSGGDSISLCPEGFYCPPSNTTTGRLPCPAGHMCPEGSIVAFPCPHGTYQDQQRRSSCETCLAGNYCEGATEKPVECGLGNYCPAGTGFPIPCPPGTYNDADSSNSGRSYERFCKECPAGKACTTAGIKDPITSLPNCAPGINCIGGASDVLQSDGKYGEICPIGSYCDDGTAKPCPVGSYGSRSGLTSSSECSECPQGFDCSEEGVWNLVDHRCEAGYTCDAGVDGVSKVPVACTSSGKYCPLGSYQEQFCPEGKWNDKATPHAECDLCPRSFFCDGNGNKEECLQGHYCPQGSSDKTMLGCPPGTYYDDTGASSFANCRTCPQGKYCTYKAGPDSPNDLPDCMNGYDCDFGQSIPSPADKKCPKGYVCPAGIKTPCPVGTFLNIEGGRTLDDCLPCPPGWFCETEALEENPKDTGNEDFKCKAGFFCFSGATSPEPDDDTNVPALFGECPPGFKCPEDGTAEPEGCPDGYYQSNAAQSECQDQCPAGYLCRGVLTDYTDADDSCPLGQFCEVDGSTPYDVNPCPPGTYRIAEGPADSEDECEVCPPGKFCPFFGLDKDVANDPAYDCDEGYYCSNENDGSWTPRPYCSGDLLSTEYCNNKDIGGICPVGSVCPATIVEPEPCPENKFCPHEGLGDSDMSSNDFNCAAGYYCSGGATTNSPNDRFNEEQGEFGEICPNGKYCEEGQSPVSCPEHFYNPQTGLGSQPECRECPPGKTCSGGFANGDCDGGSHCYGVTGVSQNKDPCDAGSMCEAGTVEPKLCNQGFHQGSTGQDTCDLCPSSYFCDGVTDVGAPNLIMGIGIVGSGHECVPGYYCPEETFLKNENPCEPGEYSAISANFSCQPCDAQVYCPGYAVSDDMISDLSSTDFKCGDGYNCTSGAYSPYGETKDEPFPSECEPGQYCPGITDAVDDCPPGTFRNVSRGAGEESCQSCPGGFKCPFAGMTEPEICDAGQFCPNLGYCDGKTGTDEICDPRYSAAASKDPVKEGYMCPPYHFCPSGSMEPNPCTDGTYTPDFDSSDPESFGNLQCKDCEPSGVCQNGQYSPECLPGYYCQDGTAIPCPAGTFNNIKTGNSIDDCEPCPDDHFCGDSGTTTPQPCKAGYVCKKGTTFGSRVPDPEAEKGTPEADEIFGYRCPEEHYCGDGTNSAPEQICPDGRYRDTDLGASIEDCHPCPSSSYCTNGKVQGTCEDGFFCNTESPSNTPTLNGTFFGPCLAGHFCVDGLMSTCPAGKFQNEEGKSSCKDCREGFYCPQGSDVEISCPPGAYCVSNSARPTYCNVGYYHVGGEKTTSSASCVACKAGFACPTIGLIENDVSNFECEAGFYCPRRSTSTRQNICTPGHYCPAGSESEKACDGTMACTDYQLDAPNEECFPGYFCPEGSDSPKMNPCPAGYHCSSDNDLPVACPLGKFNRYPLQPSEDACEPCLPGYYCPRVGMNAPPDDEYLCREGYYCPAGSETSQGRTDSEPEHVCPVGTYCPEGSARPIPCPDGYYQDNTKQEICEACPAGSYCIGDLNNDPYVGTINPIDCPEGHYCESFEDSLRTRPVPCPAGTFRDEVGGETDGDCEICEQGWICTGVGLIDTEETPCYAGYYCPERQNNAAGRLEAQNGKAHPCEEHEYCPTGSFEGIPCPDGTYRNNTGDWFGYDEASCQPCDPGKYCIEDDRLIECEAGYICSWGATKPDPEDGDTGYICPKGHYCPAGALRPEPCDAGFYMEDEGAGSSDDCFECEPGFYCPRASTNGTQHVCLEGYYCPQGSDVGNYQACPVGHECPAGSSEPEPCGPGEYAPIIKMTACLECPEGFYCPDDVNVEPKICPAGSFCVAGSDEIQLCAAGTFNSYEGARNQTDCTTCPGGYYCLDGTAAIDESIRCLPGYFCPPGTKAQTENMCQPDYYCPTGASAMQPCDAGFYSISPLASECKPCEPGYYCPRTKTDINGTVNMLTERKPCEEGHYCEGGQEFPQPCPLGTTNRNTLSSDISACDPCPEGFWCSGTNQTACDDGFHCISGSYSPSPGCSDKAAGRGEVCPLGHYCVDGFKFPCSAGTTCSQYGLTDESQAEDCPAGYYCPLGTISFSADHLLDQLDGNEPVKCGLQPESANPNTFNQIIFQFSIFLDNQIEKGVYCPQRSASPTNCPKGQWSQSVASKGEIYNNSTTGPEECNLCPEGRACTREGTFDPIEDSISCSNGYYCGKGSDKSKPDGATCSEQNMCPSGSKVEMPCPPGTYQNSQKQSKCNFCRKGHYCTGNAELLWRGVDDIWGKDPETNYICEYCDCVEGHYCPGNSTAPQPCPVGTYGRDGSKTYSKVEDCNACDGGHYCDTEGLLQSEMDNLICEAGYVCASGSFSPTPTGIVEQDKDSGKWSGNGKCPLGYFCEEGSKEPSPCPKGMIGIETGATKELPDSSLVTEFNKTCIFCPPGLYCPNEAMKTAEIIGTKECNETESNDNCPIECPEGSFCEEGSESGTIPCGLGKYCPKGTPAEIACPMGTYNDIGGLSECLPCEPGYYCDNFFGTVNPKICPVGTYCPNNNTIVPISCPPGTYNPVSEIGSEPVSKDSCLPCPEGKFCPDPGMGGFGSNGTYDCDPGFYCEEGARERDPDTDMNKPCPTGKYCPNADGIYRPLDCPIGTYNPSTHARDRKTGCLPCKGGYVCDESGLVTPEILCPAGLYCPSDEETVYGTPCPKHHMCPEGSADPIPCPLGFYQGSTGADSCIPCSAGSYCQPTKPDSLNPNEPIDIKEEICPAQYYCPPETAYPIKCPSGTYTLSDETGRTQLSDCRPCPYGKYCRDGQIQGPCMFGYLCYSGANAPNPKYGDDIEIELFYNSSTGLIEYEPLKANDPMNCTSGDVCAGPCPPGYYCYPNGDTSTIEPCANNTYREQPGGMSPYQCSTCPAGLFCEIGATEAVPCPPGHYCPAWYNTPEEAKIHGEQIRTFRGENVLLHPAPGPQRCPIYTFRNESGGKSIDDCRFCDPGYFCDQEGIVNQEDFPCKPGYYCSGQGLPPRKCPAGRMSPENHLAESSYDCLPCSPGRYCPEPIGKLINIDGILCPLGYECPGGTRIAMKCRAGYVCNQEGMASGEICPEGYYCPEGTKSIIEDLKCEFPFFCPKGSSTPQPCDLGFEAKESSNSSDGLRTSKADSCRICVAGTYRNTYDSESCSQCEPGYFCPEGTGDYTENQCDPGHECPRGNPTGMMIPCKPGTYAFGRGNEICSKCKPNTYASKEKAISCKNCGTASYSPEGAGTCTCHSDTRVFQETDSTCICRPQYYYSNDGEMDSSEFDSDGDCSLIKAPRCDNLSSKDQTCIEECGKEDHEFSKAYGLCMGTDLPLIDENCCDKISLQVQPDGRIEAVNNKGEILEPDFDAFGIEDVVASLGNEFNVEFTVFDDGIQGTRYIASTRKRRQADSTAYIEDPLICIPPNTAVVFENKIDNTDRVNSEYPVYVQDSTLNSNPEYDYGEFRILRYYVTKTSSSNVDNFIYAFTEEGTYTFSNSQNSNSTLLIVVSNENCDGSPIQFISEESLRNAGVVSTEPVMEPNWPLIIGLTTSFAILIIIGVLIFLIIDPYGWEVFSTKRFKPKFKDLAEPPLPTKIEKLDPDDDSRRALLPYNRNSSELEDFSVKNFIDKLKDQRYYLDEQISASKNKLREFRTRVNEETKRLSDEVSKMNLDSIQINKSGIAENGQNVVEVNHQTNLRYSDDLQVEEDALFVTMQEVLNKLHGGRLLISDDTLEDAKRLYRERKRMQKDFIDIPEKTDTTNLGNAVELNQEDIRPAFDENSKNREAACTYGMTAEEAEEYWQKAAEENAQADLKYLDERERQKWRLQQRLKRRVDPRYKDEVLIQQMIQTEVDENKLDKEDASEKLNNEKLLNDKMKSDNIEFVKGEVSGQAGGETVVAAMINISYDEINQKQSDAEKDLKRNYRKRKEKQRKELEDMHKAELQELAEGTIDLSEVLVRHEMEKEAIDLKLDSEMEEDMLAIMQSAQEDREMIFEEELRKQANGTLPPAVAIELMKKYKAHMDKASSRRSNARDQFDLKLKERRRAKRAARDSKIIGDTVDKYNSRQSLIKEIGRPSYGEFISDAELEDQLAEAKKRDQNLASSVQAQANKEYLAELAAAEKEMEEFDKEYHEEMDNIEAEFEQRKLELLKTVDPEEADRLFAELSADMAVSEEKARQHLLLQRARLVAKLKKRQQEKMAEAADEAAKKIKEQEDANKVDLNNKRKENTQRAEINLIKTQMNQSDKPEPLKIVKSVLDARHKKELAELEDKFGQEREELLLNCDPNERIMVLSDWEYRMNKAIVELRQQHYNELIDYLDQVCPKTADSVRANNEANAQKLKELEKDQKELEKQLASERAQWEAEQNAKIEEKLRKAEEEFEAEMRAELEKLENESSESDELKKLNEEMQAALDAAKASGSSPEEVEKMMEEWEEKQNKLLLAKGAAHLGQKKAVQDKIERLKQERLQKEKTKLEEHKQIEEAKLATEEKLKQAENLEKIEQIVTDGEKATVEVAESPVETTSDNNNELSEEDFDSILKSSDLYKVVRSLKQSTYSSPTTLYTFKSSNSVGNDLETIPTALLGKNERVVFKFCQYILSLIVNVAGYRPVTLLAASKIPSNPELEKNGFKGWFSYDCTNRFLFITKEKLQEQNPGHLYVLMAHCMAHIRTGDLTNDLNPQFRNEFYQLLAKISTHIFQIQTTPEMKLPLEFSGKSKENVEYTPAEIKAIFKRKEKLDLEALSDELGEINKELADLRRNDASEKQTRALEKRQATLQRQIEGISDSLAIEY